MSQQFEKWETLDAISCLEQSDDHSLFAEIATHRDAVEQELRDSELSFQEKALTRAKHLSQATSISRHHQEINTKINFAHRLVLLVMLLLGGFAVINVFNDSLTRVNIFWLIIVLLGVNTLSMLLYLVTLLQKKINFGSIPTLLFKSIFNFSTKKLSISSTKDNNILLKSWSTMNLTGSVGRWSFSRYLHGAWLAYLGGALAALVLILLAKQIDFVWGTTLLNGDFFVQLTSTMSQLQSSLGLPTLSTNQILSSRVGSSSNFTTNAADLAQNRQQWAYFLIISLLLFGIFPRFILWAYSILKQTYAKKAYAPEWNTPYFVELRERMIPSRSAAAIIDADTHNANNSLKNTLKKSSANSTSNKQRINLLELPKHLPEETIAIAYEWFPRHPWPALDTINDWGIISNREQQQELILKLQQSSQRDDLAFCISSEHVADRGALRFVSRLHEHADLHLLVFDFTAHKQIKRRWTEWLHFADQLKLKHERVVLVDARQPEKAVST